MCELLIMVWATTKYIERAAGVVILLYIRLWTKMVANKLLAAKKGKKEEWKLIIV